MFTNTVAFGYALFINTIMSSNDVEIAIKTPKSVVYCSDGVIEEFEEEKQMLEMKPQINLKNIPIVSHIGRSLVWFGCTALIFCDYIGENLANFFGITTPKYQYEIDEYNRQIERENKYKLKQLSEYSGWKSNNLNQDNCVHNLNTLNANAIHDKERY